MIKYPTIDVAALARQSDSSEPIGKDQRGKIGHTTRDAAEVALMQRCIESGWDGDDEDWLLLLDREVGTVGYVKQTCRHCAKVLPKTVPVIDRTCGECRARMDRRRGLTERMIQRARA